MDKQVFIEILEASLLSFDNVPKTKLISEYKFNPMIAKIGNQLCFFLKYKTINVK